MEFDQLLSKYQGPAARDYEAARRGEKWVAELKAAQDLLRGVQSGSKVLDVPVGTGRLIPVLASRDLLVTGLDASADMLAEAENCATQAGAQAQLIQGDIRELPFADESFQLVTCVRFLNWIDMRGLRLVMRELSRVSAEEMLIGVRYLTSIRELRLSPANLIPTAIRLAGVPARPIRRWGMHIHRKLAVEKLFQQLHLTIVEKRLIERRSDSTDYVFYFLRKRR